MNIEEVKIYGYPAIIHHDKKIGLYTICSLEDGGAIVSSKYRNNAIISFKNAMDLVKSIFVANQMKLVALYLQLSLVYL